MKKYYSLRVPSVMNSRETGLDSWKQNRIRMIIGHGMQLTGKKTLRRRLRWLF